MADTLKQRQEAGQEVERQLLAFLLQFAPAHELKVGDVKQIAGHARRLAFDIFSESEVQKR